ncbi:hypothetical protein [Parvularcula maris]|uniref:Gylcosyl hydrolase 115 C-terminal domain-containing protein n=1 Tax=Parvularcula maris TaxID=2965077 RepID=A0A9X2RGR2_9PROT|nr:hypothetical protein [Parvularcula maris]MCQ8184124.1 hypothetical protein [Parvularcula maris]
MTSFTSIASGSLYGSNNYDPYASSLYDRIKAQELATLEKSAELKSLQNTAARLTVSSEIDLAKSFLEGLGQASYRTVVSDEDRYEALSAKLAELDSFTASVTEASVDGEVSLSGLSRPEELAVGLTALEDATRPDELTYIAGNDAVIVDAEQYTANNAGADGAPVWVANSANDRMYATEVAGTYQYRDADDVTANAARLDYKIDFEEAGTYTVWVRGHAGWYGDTDSNSVHVGLNGEVSTGEGGIALSTTAMTWETGDTFTGQAVTINVAEAGTQTLNLWVREDGTAVDALMLTKQAGFDPNGASGLALSEITTTKGAAGAVSSEAVLSAAAEARQAILAEMEGLKTTEKVEYGPNPYLDKVIEAQERGLARLQELAAQTKEQLADQRGTDPGSYRQVNGFAALGLFYSYDITSMFLEKMQAQALDKEA